MDLAFCSDCCTELFCCPCAACQEVQEVRLLVANKAARLAP
jgi:hypothetical protein